MSFSSEDLARIAAAEEIRIETQSPEGPIHKTVVWVVVDDDQVYIRTAYGPKSRWYREATANPAVALHVDGKRLTATAIPATDPDSVQRTTDGYVRKYRGDPGLKPMIDPAQFETTLRLEPT